MSDDLPEFIKDRDMKILQIDLMSIFHLNYKHKRTSLKDVQYAFNMDIYNVQFPDEAWIQNKEFDLILKSLVNDIRTIHKFYNLSLGNTDHPVYKGINELKIRKEIRKQFKINCLNYPNVKIGEQLILSLYCKTTGKPWAEVKEMQSPRDHIDIKDCIPYFCNFKTKVFNDLLSLLKSKTIDTSLMNFETEVIFHDIKLSIGCGGIHGSTKPGIYKSDDKNVIISLDVESLYPCIARTLNLHPEHLGSVFNDLYNPFIEQRLIEKKKENKNHTLIRVFKLLINCIFGKSNESKSFLLDQLYFLRTTFAGQIFTCM